MIDNKYNHGFCESNRDRILYFKFVLISIIFQVQLRSEGGVQGLYRREKARSQAPGSRPRQDRQEQPAQRCLLKRDRWTKMPPEERQVDPLDPGLGPGS